MSKGVKNVSDGQRAVALPSALLDRNIEKWKFLPYNCLPRKQKESINRHVAR